MLTSSRAWMVLAVLALFATAARSDGIGPFSTGQSIYGGIGGAGAVSAGPPINGALMLEDGTSFLLLEDAASNLCLEGGC